MNNLEKGFKRYRRFIERMSGWETVYAGLSYETFCAYVELGNHTYTKYVIMAENDSIFIDNYIRRHKMIQLEMEKIELATEFRFTLMRHLEELRRQSKYHISMGNMESIKSYDGMIKNTLKNIDRMDRIINQEIRPLKDLKEHKLHS